MENSTEGYSLSPEKFVLVGIDEERVTAFSTQKSVSYFADAWKRFKKNKASISALIIIICIVLFAIITPLLEITHSVSFLDPYYAKMSPRVESLRNSLGVMTGAVRRTASEKRLIYLYAIGVGAMGKNGETPKINEVARELSPILSYEYKKSGADGRRFFSAEIDTYLEVGFVYMNIDSEEYQNILSFQEEAGVDVLFPLVAENEYNPDSYNANYWYLADKSANPITPEGVEIEFSEDMQLYDNYMRNSSGELVYYKTAGGSGDTAQRTVRVLYHGYYVYQNGRTPDYLLGTDSQGYDLAARVSVGVLLSLTLAVAVSAINLLIGAIWGAVAGYFGGRCDLFMSRITDILSGIPAIVVQTLFQIHLAERVGVLPSLLFAFVLTGWIPTALRTRSQFYRFKGEEYVSAARCLGASDKRIIWRHIFPNTLGTLITASVLIIPGVIFTESMLSFLGIVNLGGANITSLGTLLSEAAGIWTNAPHLMLVPAAVISLLMISFNLFGNGLRDAFNPNLRGVG